MSRGDRYYLQRESEVSQCNRTMIVTVISFSQRNSFLEYFHDAALQRGARRKELQYKCLGILQVFAYLSSAYLSLSR